MGEGSFETSVAEVSWQAVFTNGRSRKISVCHGAWVHIPHRFTDHSYVRFRQSLLGDGHGSYITDRAGLYAHPVDKVGLGIKRAKRTKRTRDDMRD